MVDFNTIPDRRRISSLKWDVKDNELPMWVADMDFRVAREIEEALKKRLSEGTFGYEIIPDTWYEGYQNWWKERHGFSLKKEGLIFTTGVIPAVSTIVRKLTTPAEKVLMLTPIYNTFYNSIENNGRIPLESNLSYKRGKGLLSEYSVDWEDLEKKMKDPQCTLMIFCNPHNPIGKIWEREELLLIGKLAKENSVTVLSDEVHCDLTDPGKEYTPFSSVSETNEKISISCFSPSKSFNLAGMHSAAVYVTHPLLHQRVWRALNTDEVAEPNSFACESSSAAYGFGAEYLDEMREYIYDNKRTVYAFIEKELKKISLVREHFATYLLWLDISAYLKEGETSKDLQKFIRESTGLFLLAGTEYHGNGRDFLRMNIATSRENINDGLNRLKTSLNLYEKR